MEFFLEKDRVKIRQSFVSPTVYFDHWALCEFSDNHQIQNRFVEIMKHKNGTFVISQLNFVEFGKMDDPKHTKATEIFLDRLMPNVYIADFAADQVIEFDLKHPQSKISLPPDLTILKLLGDRCLTLRSGLSFQGFINLSYINRYELRETLHKFSSEIAEALRKLKNDKDYVRKSLQTLPDLQRPKTYVIAGELMRDLILDTNRKIIDNDIIDLQHATLSLHCCDYTLLDGPWEQRAKKMQERITKQNILVKTAKCFSKRKDGINNFLNDLEKYNG